MNFPVLIGGLVGSFFVIMFAVIALIDGVRVAFAVVATTLGLLAASTAFVLFWVWVAGGFA